MSAVVVVLPLVPVIAMYGHAGKMAQPHLHLAHDRDARRARPRERRRFGRYAGARDDERRARDAVEIVAADIHDHADRAKPRRRRVELRARAGIGGVHRESVARQQFGGRGPLFPSPITAVSPARQAAGIIAA